MKRLEVLGLDEKKVQHVVVDLSLLLADLQVFYANLRGFHWDVKGHGFFVMHSKYEELYNDAAEKVDEVAERILQLGSNPESRFSTYLLHRCKVPHTYCALQRTHVPLRSNGNHGGCYRTPEGRPTKLIVRLLCSLLSFRLILILLIFSS